MDPAGGCAATSRPVVARWQAPAKVPTVGVKSTKELPKRLAGFPRCRLARLLNGQGLHRGARASGRTMMDRCPESNFLNVLHARDDEVEREKCSTWTRFGVALPKKNRDGFQPSRPLKNGSLTVNDVENRFRQTIWFAEVLRRRFCGSGASRQRPDMRQQSPLCHCLDLRRR